MKKNRIKKTTSKSDSERETRVLLEQIRSEVKTVAEGHGDINRKLDKANAKLEEHDRHFGTLEAAIMANSKAIKENNQAIKSNAEAVKSNADLIKANSNDIKDLKSDVKDLKAGQEQIKQKLDTVVVDHERRLQKLEAV